MKDRHLAHGAHRSLLERMCHPAIAGAFGAKQKDKEKKEHKKQKVWCKGDEAESIKQRVLI
jgi:hypothetical protein